jgi:hypothetical protein
MLTFPILGGRLFWGCLGRQRRAITRCAAGWCGQKKGRGRNRGPRSDLKSAVEPTALYGTLIELVRSVHLGDVTMLGESALPGGCPGW